MTISRRRFTGIALATVAAAGVGAFPSVAVAKDRVGSLSGRKGYSVSGTVKLVTSGGQTKVVFEDNYSFDPGKNPPDIKIGFGNGEKYAKGSKIHDRLTIKTGAASFDVPAGIDTSQYSELYIYCEQFSVILAVAR